MEKISSILKASPRVKSIDPKEVAPVRPGAPAMGRPEGRVSGRDRLSISPDAKEKAFRETLAARNPREDRHAKIAEEATRKFFETRVEPVVARPSSEVSFEPMEGPSSVDEIRFGRGQYLDTEA